MRIRITTPSRLHFGLLAWGPRAARQFGGVGLMIDRPGIELSTQPAASWGGSGPLAERAVRLAERIAARFAPRFGPPRPAHFQVHRAAAEHVGLGTGTQLALAIGRAMAILAGRPEVPAPVLAEMAGRGLRSGIGLHGFERGGLVVDGGRRSGSPVPPLICRLEFPAEWSVLVVIPRLEPGLHGSPEVEAFSRLPPMAGEVTDALCRLVLLHLLPAVQEHDLPEFGRALTEIQTLVGRSFSPAQGGTFAHPELAALAQGLIEEGLVGVGQSSWGPTIYGFSAKPEEIGEGIHVRLRDRFGLGPAEIFWSKASPRGAMWLEETGP